MERELLPSYKKSSFSDRFGRCVEVCIGDKEIRVRNSRNPNAELAFTKDEWIAFILGAKTNEFDIKE
jgi:hypothetical protein